MAASPAAFLESERCEPHQDRTKAILQQHPEIINLTGKNLYTSVFIAALLGTQLVLAYWIADQPWWFILAFAYLVGAFFTNGLFVLMHECNHNLVFSSKTLNSLAGITANLGHVMPSCVSFQRYHLTHHAFQGVHELDGDMPSLWEARVVGRSPVRKAIWLLVYPIVLAFRPTHVREVYLLSPWTIFNVVVVLAFDVTVFLVLGPSAFLYLTLCVFFALGLHPLGARWIQEHYVVSPPQETYSYYGILNRVAFNIGYHNEHHDFPAVPWNRVPQVRKIAHEWYEPLVYHRSLTKLLVQFIFDRELTLLTRVRRSDRGANRMVVPARTDVG